MLNTDLDRNLRVHADGRRLEILGARVSDKGVYTCVGENIAGTTETEFDVDVHGKHIGTHSVTNNVVCTSCWQNFSCIIVNQKVLL